MTDLLTALSLFIVITLTSQVSASKQIDRGYYWRDYKNTIPRDAISCGNDTNGQPTYIGQAYTHGDGLFVAQIFPNAKEVFVSSYGLKKAQTVTRILCTKNRNRFSWVKTSSKKFHVDMVKFNPVIGGFDHRDSNKGMLHVGRLIHHVDSRIGSVDGYLENAKMSYVHGNTLQTAEDFEVLVYDNNDDDDDEDY